MNKTNRLKKFHWHPDIPRMIRLLIWGALLLGSGPSAIQAQSVAAARTASSFLDPYVIVSRYFGKVIERPGYDYGVTVYREATGRYRMWWTGGNLAMLYPDHIEYAESTDGLSWSNPRFVLLPAPLALIADPSVVIVNGIYYMYFTGLADLEGLNDIYMATSSDGIHWTKYPDDQNPCPVIARQDPTMGDYGAGQPSVLYLNDRFIMYYLDQTDPDGLYRAESADGIHFGPPTYVMGVNDVDIKYCRSLGLFLMIRHGQFADEFSRACLHISHDGLNFTPVDNNKFIIGPPDVGDGFQLASGIVSDPHGVIGEQTQVIYAAGEYGNSNADTWDLYQSDVSIFEGEPDHVYRFASRIQNQTDHAYSLTADSPPDYNYDGVAWRTLAASEPGATPLYALYHPLRVDHLYTADLAERFRAALLGYQVQGEVGCVSLVSQPGLVPLYRLYQPSVGDHVYTIDPLERDLFMVQHNYVSEDLAGYVHWPVGVLGDLDANGVLDAADTDLLRRSLMGDRAMPPTAMGDMTGDRQVTVTDLVKVAVILH
ncbi:MAG: hypothetical protein JXQ27_02080 [Acidobacteria bacterium]|nr:hypothetical protein [Acidobacteriota bacterium]